jgi:hypothetical protein
MIELETQRLGDHEILHAFPAGRSATVARCGFLSWVYFI